MFEIRVYNRWAAGLVALLALLLYARTVGYEYVWDDLGFLSGARAYTGLEGVIKAVTEPFFLPYYYRPVALFSFVFSWSPAAQHFINTLLHAINAVMVFYCARAIMPRSVCESRAGVWAPGLAALAFAAHPAAVEAVAWVSGRFDTLMCGFVLGTCLAALGGELTRRRLALVFVLFACAMGSKESAVGLPVALPFLLLLKWRLEGKDTAQIKAQAGVLVRVLAALALAAGLYIAMRLAVVQALFADKTAEATFSGGSVLDKLNVASLALTAFVKLIVAPLSHSAPMHPFKYVIGSGLLTNTLVVVMCVLALLTLAFWKKLRFNFPLALLAALAMSWPALHLLGIPNRDNIISDRYVLAPLALLVAGLAAVAGTWIARKVPELGAGGQRIPLYVAVACLLWAGMLAAYSHATIPLWRDEITLWAFAHRQVPESKTAYSNYIATLMMQNRWREAKTEMERFMDSFPEARRDLDSISNWILIHARLGNYEEGRKIFVLAGEMWGNMRDRDARNMSAFWGNMGVLEFYAGNMELAERYLETSLRISPENPGLASMLVRARAAGGRVENTDSVRFP